jgi:hypothetical protein
MVASIGQLKGIAYPRGRKQRTALVYVAVVPHPDLLPNDNYVGQDVTGPGWYHVNPASGLFNGPYPTRQECVMWSRRSPVWA